MEGSVTNCISTNEITTVEIKEVTVVEVRNPLNHEFRKKKYTDYEICLKTTSKAFMISQSFVRRRYSDFVWLRSWLSENNEAYASRKMPPLPPKKLVKRFDSEFLEERRKGLQKFLKKVLERNVFLSDKALHLFLQSTMHVKQIKEYLKSNMQPDIFEINFCQVDGEYIPTPTNHHIDSDTTSDVANIPRCIDNESLCTESSLPMSYDSSTSCSWSSYENVNVGDCIDPQINTGSGNNIISAKGHTDTEKIVTEVIDDLLKIVSQCPPGRLVMTS